METKELTRQIEQLIAEITYTKIENQEQYSFVAQWLQKNKSTQKIVNDFFKDQKERRYAEYKNTLTEIKKYIDPLEKAEASAKAIMIQYNNEQEKIRREEQKRIQEEIRKKEEEKLIEKAIEKNDEKILEKEIFVPEIKLEQPKTKGISTYTIWRYEIIDINILPKEFMLPDKIKIQKIVETMKEKTNIQGIKVFPEQIIRSSGYNF